MRVERIGLSEWEDALPEAGVEVFHEPEALEVLGKHASGELQLYAGFKGQQPVGLFPVVERRHPIGAAMISPPPGLGVPWLGPVTMPTSPKRRKREKVNAEFTERVLGTIDVDSPGTLFRTVCAPGYTDPRPFIWRGYDLETAFTYRLDVESRSPDELKRSFSKSLRREIGDAEDLELAVGLEGIDGTRAVFEDTRERYEEQDRGFPMSWDYVRDLVQTLDERTRTYVARDPDGTFLSGVTVLYSNESAYFWQGGTRTIYEGVSVNSLLHWLIIEDLIEDPPYPTVTSYDLMGANTERLCRYKSKFGADLVPYYIVESGGTPMNMAKKAYRMVAR